MPLAAAQSCGWSRHNLPKFLLVTAWEAFGGDVCLSSLEINSSPISQWWRCNGGGLQQGSEASVQMPSTGRINPLPGTLPLGRGTQTMLHWWCSVSV